MTITLRSVKGSNLTAAEVDGNFTDLDGRVTSIENNTILQGEGVATITYTSGSFTFTGTASTAYGTFDITPDLEDAALKMAMIF